MVCLIGKFEMNKLLKKYNSLDRDSKILLLRFIDFLSIESQNRVNSIKDYKKRILNISEWNDDDLLIYDNIKTNFQKWNIEKW
jgi:hypothetical protein